MQRKDQYTFVINRFDADFLRGVAILMIMLHNYYHIMVHAPGENEFSFSLEATHRFMANLSARPQDTFRQSFSFLGHYGVQLFIFLSGYGLAVRYGGDKLPAYRTFILRRLRKLYPVLLLAVTGLFFYKLAADLLFPTKDIDLSVFIKEALLKLTLLANLVPGQALSITGPWWFFSLIFQLYLLAPLLLRIRQGSVLLGVMATAWLLQWLVLLAVPQYIDYLRFNFLGHLPEFCLGILLAMHSEKRIEWAWLLLSLPVFMLGSFNPYVWITAFSCVPLLGLAFYKLSAPGQETHWSRLLRFYGRNSLYFFAIHSLCRPPFVALGNRSLAWSFVAALLYLLVVTALTLLFRQLLYWLMQYFSRLKLPIAVRPPH